MQMSVTYQVSILLSPSHAAAVGRFHCFILKLNSKTMLASSTHPRIRITGLSCCCTLRTTLVGVVGKLSNGEAIHR